MCTEIKNATISKFGRNCLGTVDIYMTVPRARKEQEFSVYPIARGSDATVITIQSGTRFGRIDLSKGRGIVSASHSNGSNSTHYRMDIARRTATAFTLTTEDVNRIKLEIFGTTDSEAGRASGIMSDNSGAVNVL